MIIVSVERNRVLHQHSGQTWAEIVPFSQAPHTGRLVYLWKEWVTHDEDGLAAGTLRERAGQITVLRVRKPVDVLELDLEIARSCGHRTSQALRDAWWMRHPRTPLVAVVYFVLGDWRDRDVFMNFSGRGGGDFTRNARRALDPDAPVLTREEIEQLSFDGRQRDDARRAKASAALTTETSSQRLLRIENYIEQLRVTAGDEAARAAYSTVRQELRIVRQRLTKAERRRLGASSQ